MVITTSYRRNRPLMRDFNHVAGRSFRRRKVLGQRIFYSVFGVLGILSGVLLLTVEQDSSNTLIAVLGLLFGILFSINALFYYHCLGFFAGHMMTKEIDEVQYTFDEETVTIDNALEHCQHPYGVFRGVYESRRIFVLMLTPRLGYIIAKDDLSTEEEEQIRTILQTRFSVPLIQYDF